MFFRVAEEGRAVQGMGQPVRSLRLAPVQLPPVHSPAQGLKAVAQALPPQVSPTRPEHGFKRYQD
jgi:methyl-accepting chemotaxis protein